MVVRVLNGDVFSAMPASHLTGGFFFGQSIITTGITAARPSKLGTLNHVVALWNAPMVRAATTRAIVVSRMEFAIPAILPAGAGRLQLGRSAGIVARPIDSISALWPATIAA